MPMQAAPSGTPQAPVRAALDEAASLLSGAVRERDASAENTSQAARLPEGASPFAATLGMAMSRTDVAAPVYQATLASLPQQPGFSGEVAAQVQVMVDGGVQTAQLNLNPSDLGPIQIQLSLTGQSADISFTAAHQATREGLEQSLPALRDMLAAQGLSLGHAGVSSGQQQAPRDGREAETAASNRARQGSGDGGGERTMTVSTPVRASRGMLDLYA